MRAIFLILILAVVAIIGAVSLGLIDVSQVRGAKAPTVEANNGKITATGGQSPKFEVETGSVGVGTREQNVTAPSVTVKVPVVEVNRPADKRAQPQTNTAQ
ncbi:MAG: hypothetical protein H0W65_05340 [Sphingomonas sp.]|uniref:hypothetical protein n=1 Tax=Sphingomonas sp. TaxID=28214 RepID=UPI0017BE00C2|nr:hypothetical protein [Sphingomonas sp.]MBA3667128.1 hypothetical protein [Sphingomonas sp.]